MAEDTVNKAIETAGLQPSANVTKDLPIHGSKKDVDRNDHMYVYGSDREDLLALVKENPEWGEKLHPRMEYIRAEVIWAEMTRTVEDVLARRVRMLFLDAQAAIDTAPSVAKLMAKELNRDNKWEKAQVADFTHIAKGYLLMAGC
jgi:glycerol-3-phosphate dehydrogenase